MAAEYRTPRTDVPEFTHAFTAPQHVHVLVWCYDGWNEDANQPIGKTCDVTVIGNDVAWCEREAIRLSGRTRGHRTNIVQCADETHLKNLDLS